MDLFELALLAEECGLDSIDGLIEEKEIENNNKNKDLKLISPKKYQWIKFNSDKERKELLKGYKHLNNKDIFKYISNEVEFPCSIVGYLKVKDENNYDHLVLQFENDRLHIILADYFVDMQSN